MNVVINLNKPEHISSQQAVLKVQRFFSAKKAGHAGTLDPMATGVLLVCLNEATKITRFLSDLDKEYRVRVKFGERTDTCDATGSVIEKTTCDTLQESDIRNALNSFTGLIHQTPPMYSAIKLNGSPLYKLARKGITVERAARPVTVSEIEMLGIDLPSLDLRIVCSKGTYIRTICDDLGQALGVGAHMVSLIRTRIGGFRIEDSAGIEEADSSKHAVCSIDSALSHLGEIILDDYLYRRAMNGIPIDATYQSGNQKPNGGEIGSFKNYQVNQYVRIKSPDRILFGIGKVEQNRITIERLLN
jgi:tRNA pseudouridine55 synthase